MAQPRSSITAEAAADALFASDNTCCVCRERGKAVQIHHVNENPTNHVSSNLAVLCLECHNQTQIEGGFGRRLKHEVVVRFRDEWLVRVQQRRDIADQLAVAKLLGEQHAPLADALPQNVEVPQPFVPDDPLDYVNSLPDLRKELRDKAQPEWDTGNTSQMVQASYNYIDALQGILTALARYYPLGHFSGKDPHQFFSEQISLRFEWHRSYVEPGGPGTGGTIVNVICCNNVIADVEKMVEDMTMSLIGYDDRFDWRDWPNEWRGI